VEIFQTHGIDIYCWIIGITWFIGRFVRSPKILQPAEVYHPVRAWSLFTILCLIWTGVLAGLSILWYNQDQVTGFHWFNDNDGWLQIDKAGHFFTTFQEARLMMLMWKWTGVRKSRAAIFGALGGFLYQTPIELLDGFQESYGASWGDLLANTAGAVFFYVQIYFTGKLFFVPKFSVSGHSLASMRPEFFGDNFFQQILKDYNGQTYWMCLELPRKMKGFLPAWLSLCVGYSAEGMLGGEDNIYQDKSGKTIDFSDITRYRQILFSLDINWAHIPKATAWMHTSTSIISLIKCPAPTLEWNPEDGFKWHWIYF